MPTKYKPTGNPTGRPKLTAAQKLARLDAMKEKIKQGEEHGPAFVNTDPNKPRAIGGPLPLGVAVIPTVPITGPAETVPSENSNGTKEEVSIPITAFITPEEEPLIKEALADLMSEDIPRWLENGVHLLRAEGRCVIHPVSRGRALFWAKFALPMLKQFFPNMTGVKAFAVLTFITLGSMVEMKELPPKKGSKNVQHGD